MIIRNISEAKTQLSALLEAVQRGEEVILSKAGKPIARIIAHSGQLQARSPGTLRGKVQIAADFDQLPKDLGKAFGITK